MKASEIAARINGFSTPFFGVSWVPPVPDVQVARRVITFVEVRRVLFASHAQEVPEECVASVLQIRDFLTDTLMAGGIGQALEGPVRLARGYCVRFLDRVGMSEASVPNDANGRHLFQHFQFRMMDNWFAEALGELRAGVSLQIAIIARDYGLDVEDDLARMIPET
jgi:hypothetical protein